MATLIFKTVKDLKSRFGNSEKIEFVKKGSFTDAMNYFDDQYPLFTYEEDNDEFDFSIDEKGYIKDSSGEIRFTFSELENSESHVFDVDGGYFRNYYTTNSCKLSDDELIAISDDYQAEDYFLENGYSKLNFRLAEYFKDFSSLIKYGDRYYEEFEINISEPDNDFFEFEGKYYTKIDE